MTSTEAIREFLESRHDSKRHGSMYEWRMKPQPPKPIIPTAWLELFDKI